MIKNYIGLDSTPAQITDILRKKHWIGNETVGDISKPGEGNMNVVVRVQTGERSFILKQSRPYVQKYQQVEAPLNRIATEFQFYETVKAGSRHFPRIYHYDPEDHLLMMEDLGNTIDFSEIYNDRSITGQEIERLCSILTEIHSVEVPTDFPDNMGLRQLNYQHIFVLPFTEDNGFDLDSIQDGLRELSRPILSDAKLIGVVHGLGDQYLSEGDVLLHGDYYPGSWMRTEKGLYVLDPEFSFKGFREFDIGVMAAHLIMASMDVQMLRTVTDRYNLSFNEQKVKQMAGIEMIRRIIGLAQLPLERSLKQKRWLLDLAVNLIR